MEKQSSNKKKGFGAGFICGLVCCLFIVLAGYGGQLLYENIMLYYSRYSAVEEDNTEYDTLINARSINKIEAIEEIIRTNYYKADEINNEDMEIGMYRGILAALNDPYAQYYTADELIRINANIEGVFYGIGALISYDDDRKLAVISGIIEGGSAAESDLREGDYIVSVDDVDVTNYSSSEVVSLVRGQENTLVSITVYRESANDYITFDLIRKKILEKDNVTYGLTEDPNIGYIHISEFDNITIKQFNEALDGLKEHEIRGLILDLRSNPGGNIDSVTSIARRILPEGLIVYTEDSHGYRIDYRCDGENELEIPLVVLVNRFTASAAEILAGAIQDHEKGTVVGQETFGKSVVQRIVNMSDRTAVKLTVSTYYTPLGRNLGETGIIPDIKIDLDYEAYHRDGLDNQVEEAIRILTDKIY